MSDLVTIAIHDNIAVITINNPPVNALSLGVVQGLAAALEQTRDDDRIEGLVFVGAGTTFIAGFDINEFVRITSGEAKLTREVPDLLCAIENFPKPVVAAIRGTAFGGGLELAMACHYRVASPGTQLGQPEVKLGIIPGAGGTQRLPRLAGVVPALEMCAIGNPIDVAKALELGIVDRVVEGDLLEDALRLVREARGKELPRTRERIPKIGSAEENRAAFAEARGKASKRLRGMKAPLAAIDAVEGATKLGFAAGCELEQKLFNECLFSEESKALVHVFFAEREAAKIPDIPRDTATIPVNSAAVLGSGTMGSGIAMVLANAGIPVFLSDQDSSALERGMGQIRRNYETSLKQGRLSQQLMDERLRLIKPTTDRGAFSEVDLVIEAVFENMELKKQVFSELDKICKPGAILATNTSTLDVDEIGAATSRPEAVLGIHFFSPANIMRLLEIVSGKDTRKDVIATLMQLSKRFGKVAVLVGNCFGFVANRMFLPYLREAFFLAEEGADPEYIDRALYDFGMAMGPLATADLAGLDVGWRIRKERAKFDKPGVRRTIADDRLCEMGRFGQKTGAGWYKYDENRRAIPDPGITRLIRSWSAEAGIKQRNITAEEIVDRCVFGLVNEGARVLEEGYALRSGDIDTVFVNGYGFPTFRGGPMWFADTVGLKRVYTRVEEFYREHGELWEPAPLLKELAESGSTFASFTKRKVMSA